MASIGIDLPNINDGDLDNSKERRKILEYLYQLSEQLRYTLSNLGEENLSQELADTINGAAENSEAVDRKLTDSQGNFSLLEQKVDSLKLEVSNGESSSTIKLMAGALELASQIIQFTGDVVFANNLTDGTTVISGDNIQTGVLRALELIGVRGTFDELDAVGGLVHLGQNYITINGIEIGYVPGYSQVCVVPPSDNSGNLGTGASSGMQRAWNQVVAYNFNNVSTRKLKKNIQQIRDEDYESIDKFRPVTYEKVRDTSGKRYLGFIAEELKEVCPLSVAMDDDGEPYGIDYGSLTVVLVNEIKKLRSRVAALEAKEEKTDGELFVH